MDKQIIADIAEDAAELGRQLAQQGIRGTEAQARIVAGAMPGFVTAATKAVRYGEATRHPGEDRQQARWGTVPRGSAGISRDITRALAIGPEQGQDMQLVIVTEEPGLPARTSAMAWIRANRLDAGIIQSADYAGRTAEGKAVYLVTYELRDPGGPRHPGEDRQQRQAREIHGIYGRTLEDDEAGDEPPP